jgi:N-glycosidase YbiA
MTIDRFAGDHRFLSNFWLVPVVYDGEIYPTVEHAYQAAKTLSLPHRKIIAGLPTPGQAKRAGRNVPIREGWSRDRIDIMRALVLQKFAPPSPLADILLATAPHLLVEGNTWGDRFWGQCDGTGENHLGKILMDARDRLIEISEDFVEF